MKMDTNTQEMTLETSPQSVELPSAAADSEHNMAATSNDFGASAVIAEDSDEADEADEAAAIDPASLSPEELVKAKADLEKSIVEQLHTIYDPEIPVDIYELGLIYEVRVADDFSVVVQMTLTSPACPVAGSLPLEVEDKTLAVDGVKSARVELVWDPPWTPDMMSEAAQLELGFF